MKHDLKTGSNKKGKGDSYETICRSITEDYQVGDVLNKAYQSINKKVLGYRDLLAKIKA
ncbi:hypothetical protein J8M21_11640 [Pseudoalteromonas luteoviolacea]|uniref:Uncharacterized protein n=1 Tax=Pseudoalteromonas luteoviolacea H33 TaxID=1365251 RepID=A0A167A8X9_9GAMM|nr:hypothetical protein [Pseudoalteromonas luteoviolacea]KZN45110.1 hypothetical protein N476_26000 [Pseudoalteromonas luteoviolacea H33]KZN79217.1 hypothetical protein N477_00020 [Pseudoalteromonas luteoviolacea H33-S]MBQ4877859.1 hypothetical protein [Pseudoalteromonas luteoviolacea]MBQ4906894.1 hypothetical protein [Pseudoalteromonas luteoviolacea]